MSHSFDVLIVGAGVVGLTASLAMAAQGYTCAVIDAGALSVDTGSIDPRVYAINKASQSLFEQLGVWQHLDKNRVSPYQRMYVWDALNGACIDFDSRSIAAATLGTIIEESIIKQALMQQIAVESKITLFAHSAVNELKESDTFIELFSQEHSWQGALLVIADGAHSPLRQKLKVPFTQWSYQQHAVVATVETELGHHKTAYQVFHSDGPLAFLPLAKPQQCSIVWSTTPERTEHIMALDEESFNRELSLAFAKKLGMVTGSSKRYQFPLHMRHVHQYCGARWLLMGDAAHTIHPLAGLGLNVGLADVACWARQISCVDTLRHLKKILGAYQRERKTAVWQTIVLMEGLKRVFAQSSSPLSSLRALGIRTCNQLPVLKRLFIEHAEGS